jgi:hypothetical protein
MQMVMEGEPAPAGTDELADVYRNTDFRMPRTHAGMQRTPQPDPDLEQACPQWQPVCLHRI